MSKVLSGIESIFIESGTKADYWLRIEQGASRQRWYATNYGELPLTKGDLTALRDWINWQLELEEAKR